MTTFDFTAFPVLTTSRLRLRQMTHDDADGIIRLFGHPEMMRFLNAPLVTHREQAIGMIDWFAGNYREQIAIDWAVTRADTGEMIGMCGVHKWNPECRSIELGYNIAIPYWGQGYATEAAHGILQWAFDALDLHRIQANCTDGNLASERVLLKLGFKVEGLFRESCWEHGRFVDIKYFGLLRREYVPPR